MKSIKTKRNIQKGGDEKQMKKESGITLIALIITIIILVILAAVSIRAVYNMGIVEKAINGTKDYAQASKDEENMFGKTENYIEDAVLKINETTKEEPPMVAFTQNDVEYTWEDVHNMAKIISGTSSITKTSESATITYKENNVTLQVGQEMNLKDTEGNEYGEFSYIVRILGFNTDRLASASNKNGDRTYAGEFAGISFEFVNKFQSLTEGKNGDWSMNNEATNANGWKATKLRTELNNSVNRLVNSKYIKTVKKEYNEGNGASGKAATPSEDKLWLLAASEIWTTTNGDCLYDFKESSMINETDENEEKRYAYYAKNNPDSSVETDITKKYVYTNKTSPVTCWLRTPNKWGEGTSFIMCNSVGKPNACPANLYLCVAPGFCI